MRIAALVNGKKNGILSVQTISVGRKVDPRDALISETSGLTSITAYLYVSYKTLENCPSIMTGKSKVALKNTFLLKSVTKQHIKIKITTYLCLITKAANS
jgi:hypothetical protein